MAGYRPYSKVKRGTYVIQESSKEMDGEGIICYLREEEPGIAAFGDCSRVLMFYAQGLNKRRKIRKIMRVAAPCGTASLSSIPMPLFKTE